MREQKVNNQLSRRPKGGCRITPLAASAFRSNWVLFRTIYDLYESRTGKRWSREEVSDLNHTTTQAPPAARLCRSRSEAIFSFLHMFASRAMTGVFKLPTSTAGAHPHQSRQPVVLSGDWLAAQAPPMGLLAESIQLLVSLFSSFSCVPTSGWW